jgi:diguanylate cyclase (GGDEF)-like protein/PAS domain S-box-containing protein
MKKLATQLDASERHGGQAAPRRRRHFLGILAAAGKLRSRPIMLLIVTGIALITTIAIGTTMTILNLRDRALSQTETELRSLAIVLAEQTDRSFQAVELVQNNLIDRMQLLGIATGEDFERKMSGNDTHLLLKGIISGLPYLDAVTMINPQGKLINFSRYWPIPAVNVSDRDYFKALKSDANLTSFISKPVHNRGTGTWTIYIARRFSGPNGEFLGLVLGAIELRYFEEFYKKVSLGPETNISLIRRDGMLLARHPYIEASIGKSLALNPLFSSLISKANFRAVRMTSDVDGQDRLIAAYTLPNYPIVVTVGTTVTAALADWRSGAWSMASFAVLLAIVVGGIIFLSGRQIAKRLHAKNAQLDSALSNMSQGLVMFDSAARLIVCNDRYREMCKLPPDLVKPGRTFHDIFKYYAANGTFSGNPEEYIDEFIATITKGKAESREIKTDDGRIILVVNQPIADGGWVTTQEDITERKQADAVIEESHRNLERAETIAQLGHYKFEKGATAVTWSDGLYRIVGKSPESFTPTLSSVLELVHPDDRPALEKYRRDAMAGLDLPPLTLRLFKDDGQIIYVENSVKPLRAGDGSAIGMFGTLQDITERCQTEVALTRANQALIEKQYAIDQAVIVAITDVAGRITYANNNFCKISGYTREELLGNNHRILNSGSHSKTFFRDMYRVIAKGQIWRGEICNKAKGGSLFWLDTTIVPQLGPDGKPVAYMVIRIDITNRKRGEEELYRTKKFLDTVIEYVPSPIAVKDVSSSAKDAHDCRFTLLNRAGEELLGVAREQIIGKTANELYPKETADLVIAHDNKALCSEQMIFTPDYPFTTPGNGIRLVTARKVAIRDADGKPQYLLAVLDDVTERRQSDAAIAHMAHFDTLTGLPNRATFNDTMDATFGQAATKGEQFAILSIDLDRFKEANDTYGHIVGDALLREVARRLQVAAEEAFIARIGGDEFALIVTDGPQPATASALAERLLAAIVDDFEVEGHRLKLGLSIGGAVYPTDGTDMKTLMINADAALYRAKAETRGTALFFEPEMSARLRERRALQEDLRSAVARGELLLHYQPQFRMAGETIGFEALVRWQCPKRGMVPPGVFIPIAENSSLIISVGEWILRESCREAASWPQPLTIAVNISPIQFRHGDLPRLVHTILLETGLAPDRLELEITESVMINDFSRAISILNRLKSLGVKIAMDDFGTGYSSLSYLQSFKCDKIKIDRIFVCDLETNHHSRAIVHAVIGLGRSLNLPILAEGVETEAQHAYLMQEGCDEVQGYLTGRPLPIADHAKLVGRQAIAQQNCAVAG